MSGVSFKDRVRASANRVGGEGLPVLPGHGTTAQPASESTALRTFLALTLPGAGQYILFQNKAHTFHQSLDDLAGAVEARGDSQGLYFATAAYGPAKNRTAANVLALKAFRVDIDAGEEKFAKHPTDTYPTQRDALAALIAFVKATGLAPTLIVSSGEGLHVYWCLDAAVGPEAWKPVALQLNAVCRTHGLKVDAQCTADTARVLRPVGALHKNGKRVTVLKDTGSLHMLDSFAARLRALSPEQRIAVPGTTRRDTTCDINADVLGPAREDRRDRDAGLIARQCPMVGEFFNGVPQPEPVWRQVAAVLKFCRNGETLWHEGSAKDPRYDRSEAQGKWDRYEAGPPRCGGSTHCETCTHKGRISSPVQLGDVPADLVPGTGGKDSTEALSAALEAGGLQFIMDTDGRQNVVTRSMTDNGRHVRAVQVANSEAATDAITAIAAQAGRRPSVQAVETYCAQQRHYARKRGEAVPVHLRVAHTGGDIYHDLGPSRIAHVSAAGVEIVDDTADGVPLFRRGSGAGHLPDPDVFTDPADALRFAVDALCNEFGLTRDQALLTVVTVLEYFRTETTHPILEIVGPGGSGKSTVADFVRGLIDPAADGGRVTVGTGGDDIAAAAQQQYVLTLDNAGHLDADTSNMLCVVSTGGTLVVRLLYTNGETANLKLHRPLVVTAVVSVCRAADLQTRVIGLDLPARSGDYVSDETLGARLDALRPKMLGALYCLLSGALRELAAVRQRRGWGRRLVDYEQMGEAVLAAAGVGPGAFSTIVARAQERRARRSASGDAFLLALLDVLRRLAAAPTHEQQQSLNAVISASPAYSVVRYDGSRAEVTARPGAIHKLLPLPPVGAWSRGNAIPATERALADALRRIQPLLAGLGVTVRELAYGTRTLIRFDFDVGALDVA